jgi:beta-glucosidase
MTFRGAAFGLACTAIAASSSAASVEPAPWTRAVATEQKMTPAERATITLGIMAVPYGAVVDLPEGAIYGAGFIPGIQRLGIPALTETDASLGVAYASGFRKDGGATPLPSGVALGATWDPDLVRRGGAMIGAEARAKGFNVMLAGGVNLMRDPRNGRTFEYIGEDPLHSGILAGALIAGVQSNHIISTIKHYALNGQETGRHFLNSRISDAAARESDLLAFQIAIEKGQPGAVMCGYNKVNGAQACGSEYLLNKVLKTDWRYRGFVMSDWGAVNAIDFALKGLDQQSGVQLDPKPFFGADLLSLAARDPLYRARLADMNRRVLYAIYANKLDTFPVKPGGLIDKAANAGVAEKVAQESIVLLRNQDGVLPLAKTAKRIAVIGGYADTGVLSGGGSSQVHLEGGASAVVSHGGLSPFASLLTEQYLRALPPLDAIRAMAPDAQVTFRSGDYVGEAVQQARNADIVIVFANQWQTEGIDSPDLTLPRGQDALIEAITAANPKTIVVLQSGSAVAMPWLERTAAVIEAWYPGGRGGQAIASVLFGDVNPSGRLPITFPASLDQLPRPKLDGSDSVEPNFLGLGTAGQSLTVNYDIEGADIGYRWNARKNFTSLFPLGFGLSFTSFEYSDFTTDGVHATFTIQNIGKRAGATVAQVYLTRRPDGKKERLVAFQKVELAAGERRQVTVPIERRVIADWASSRWNVRPGTYAFALGDNAEKLGPTQTVRLSTSSWAP